VEPGRLFVRNKVGNPGCPWRLGGRDSEVRDLGPPRGEGEDGGEEEAFWKKFACADPSLRQKEGSCSTSPRGSLLSRGGESHLGTLTVHL
jgi:hypothetical protein